MCVYTTCIDIRLVIRPIDKSLWHSLLVYGSPSAEQELNHHMVMHTTVESPLATLIRYLSRGEG